MSHAHILACEPNHQTGVRVGCAGDPQKRNGIQTRTDICTRCDVSMGVFVFRFSFFVLFVLAAVGNNSVNLHKIPFTSRSSSPLRARSRCRKQINHIQRPTKDCLCVRISLSLSLQLCFFLVMLLFVVSKDFLPFFPARYFYCSVVMMIVVCCCVLFIEAPNNFEAKVK